MQPRTQYAKSGDVHIAYQVFGEGAVDLVFVPGFVSHIENYWDEPNFARWLRSLGNFSRVIMFDKRGTGLSDQVSELPGMDQRMDDVRAVMDAVGIERAAIFGISEGGSLSTLFAATHPERTQALIIYGGFAQFSSWFPTQEALESLIQYIDKNWGSGESMPMFAPTKEGDLAFQQWWGKFERLGASPAAAITLMRMNNQIDITEILPSINVPTLVIHRKDDVTVNVEGGRLLAERIPEAKYVELSGADHLPFVGENSDRILDEMEHFLTGKTSTPSVERMLATVVFTDIVGSTARAHTLGDRAWGDLQDLHDKAVRKELARFRGNEVKWTGDGFLAAFDRPARAIQCALTIVSTVRALGIEVRAGIHTGEVDFVKNDIRGIAVHIASRVADLANGGDVVVSRTVKDLVAGSGISFQDYGTHELKGVPDQWTLFRARANTR
jgi:class 3 adenylate cyclase